MSRSITPPRMVTMVTIDTVDIAKRIVHCVRGNGDVAPSFWAHFRYTGDSFQMPAVNERWMVERVGFQWRLLNRMESPGEEDFRESLEPGDNHVRAVGTLHLHASSIKVVPRGRESASLGLGATRWERRVTTGATTSWTLTDAPTGIETVQLFNNGALVDPSTLTLADNVLTFASIATGHTLVCYYQAV